MSALVSTWYARIASRPTPLFVAAAAAVPIVALVIGAKFLPLGAVVAIFLLLCALPFVVFDNFKLLMTMIFLMIVLELPRLRFPFIPIAFDERLVMPFFGIMGINWMRERLDRADFDIPRPAMLPMWLILGFLVAVLSLRGIAGDVRNQQLVNELTLISYYFAFFFALDCIRTRRQVRTLMRVIVLGTMAVCLEYIVMAYGFSSASNGGRVVSQQANLTIAAGSILCATFVTQRASGPWAALGFLPLAIIVVLSGQRSLIIAIPFSLGLAVLLAARARLVIGKRVATLALVAVLGLGAAWVTVSSVQTGATQTTVGESLSRRTDPTEAASSASLVIRLLSFAHVWENRILEKPILGWGIGNTAAIPILRGGSFNALRVDNSYITLLWKGGIVALAAFLLWYGLFLRKGWQHVRHPDPEARVVSIVIFATLAGVLVASLASSMITHYRFSTIWATMMAILANMDEIYAPGRGEQRSA